MYSAIEDIDFYNIAAFKVWNFNLIKSPESTIIDSLAILLGDYSIERKYAATLILKILVRDEFRKILLENRDLYPYDRNDYRVFKWRKQVLKRGKCEKCGTTEKLEAHHIIKWADCPQGRIDIQNGMCLCHKCHTEEHIDDASYYMMKAK